MSKRYCMKVNLNRIIREKWKMSRLDGLFLDDNGKEIGGERALILVNEWWSKGLECGPPCDHQDAKGNCLGHEENPK